MTILQQPDALSLSQNLKDFRISSDTEVSFVLKQGNSEILSQRYDPSSDGHIIINLRDVVHSRLSYQLIESGQVYEQPSLVSDFTAIIDGLSIVTFRVIRSGIDRFADSATNFLKQNFLTWQPSIKPVTYYSPEFLTYYAVVSSTAKLRAYFTDSAGSIASQVDYTIAEMSAGIAYTMPLQYSVVAGWLGNKLPAYYDVWIENASGQRLTYIQRYHVDDMRTEQEQWVLFENSLGGLDTFRAYGTTTFNGEHTHNLAEIDEVSQEYRVDTERKYQKNTGHLNQDERKWLLDFFPSQAKYLYVGNYLRQIVVTESNVSYTDRALPSNYTFTFRYADARPLLNLPRTDVPADVLNITVPSVGSFSVPPRLAEFPRLPLSEGALFPVQNPYSEEWGTTTGEALATFIGQLLSSFSGSSGGVGHQHKNIDLLNALSYIQEYLLVNGKKLKSGYADIAGNITGDKYIRKDRPDSTNHLLKLFDGVEIGTFIEALATRSGAKIDKQGNGTFVNLSAQSLKVLELIFNRLTALEGDFVFTESGTVKSVEDLGENTYRLEMDKRWENDFTALDVDDVLRSSVNNMLATGVHYMGWYRLLSKNTAENTITVVMYGESDCPGKVNLPPAVGMVVHRWGNTSNEERQRCWYMSSSEGRLVYLTGVNKPIVTQDMYASFYGLPVMLDILDGHPINEKEPYLFVRGLIAQDIIRVDRQGRVQYEIVDRGSWSSEIASSDDPYLFEEKRTSTGLLETHDVWHNSCRYRCLKSRTTQEPKWNSPDWDEISGDPTLWIDFEKPNGDAFFNEIDCPIYVHIYKGVEEITDDILDADIEWSRSSSDPVADIAWPATHPGEKKYIHIAEADCPSEITDFTCKVFVRDGKSVRNIERTETIEQ